MEQRTYDDTQRSEFVELASQIGIGRAIRELGYPNSYATGQAWCKARGVNPNRDTAYAQLKEWHTLYQVEDLLLVGDEIISVIQSMLINPDLSADEVKKLTEAYQKATNTRLLLEGKSTSITEHRETTEESEFEKALHEFYAQTDVDTQRVSE